MQSKILIALALSAPMAFAQAKVRSVFASDYNCADLQRMVKQEGALHIRTGFFGLGRTYHASEQACGAYSEAYLTSVRAADTKSCRAGWVCNMPTQTGDTN